MVFDDTMTCIAYQQQLWDKQEAQYCSQTVKNNDLIEM